MTDPDPKTVRRNYSGPAFFSFGFRPFFVGAGLFAVIAIGIWIGSFVYDWSVLENRDMMAWHAHEMIFGYLGSVLAGFVLTAIPNWTGRLPMQGLPLAGLFGLWLAGRVAMLLLPDISLLRAVIDAAFLIVMSLVIWREISAGKNWRNMPVALLVTLFAAANITFHAESIMGGGDGYGQRTALAAAMLLITVIGGRIVPSFTLNWMKKQNLPALSATFGPWDKLVIIVTALAALLWVAWPYLEPTGWALLMAGVAQSVRLARWRGWKTISEPLVLVLHIGYAWLAAALLLMGAAILFPGFIGPSAALHALTTGAIGMMTVAVMTRAILGHTGRPLTAGIGTTLLYLSLLLSAALRVFALITPWDYQLSLSVSGAFWMVAYLLFAVLYGPMLIKQRTDSAAARP